MATVVYSCPQMEALTAKIASLSGATHGVISWKSFPDGTPNIMINNVHEMRGKDVVFLASFDTPGDIFTQLSVIYAIPRYLAGSFKVVLPYFPMGTMERVDEDGQIATAKTLARMLSVIPPTLGGPAQIIIYDIHALQELFYFGDGVLPRFESGIPLLKARLQSMPVKPTFAIAFPDDGAAKRFGKLCAEFPQIICIKVRKGDKRVVTIKEGDVQGRNVVIVDDLVQTGGTLIECKDALFAQGAVSVSAYVTHGVFPQNSWRKFIGSNFQNIWITDSCPRTALYVKEAGAFEVLSLAPLIAQLIHEEG